MTTKDTPKEYTTGITHFTPEKALRDDFGESPEEITRCGYCGVFMVNGVEVPEKELPADIRESDYKMGYCSNAMAEHYEQNPEDIPQT